MVQAKEKHVRDDDIDLSVISHKTCGTEHSESISLMMREMQGQPGIPVILFAKSGQL